MSYFKNIVLVKAKNRDIFLNYVYAMVDIVIMRFL